MWSNITAAYDERTDDITLYPNPTRGSITITGIAGITNIDAWDIYGRKLDSSYYYDDASRCQMEVQLSPGMVLIKIETPSEVIYRKIMMTQ